MTLTYDGGKCENIRTRLNEARKATLTNATVLQQVDLLEVRGVDVEDVELALTGVQPAALVLSAGAVTQVHHAAALQASDVLMQNVRHGSDRLDKNP